MKKVRTLIVCICIACALILAKPIGAHAQSKVKKSYAKILKKKKYTDKNYGTYQFAIQDLNADGIPELLVMDSGITVTTEIYTYHKGKSVKTNEPDIPAWGTLYVSKKRKSFIYFRGGPAEEDGMPYTMIEQKLKNKKISTVNYFTALTDRPNGKKDVYYKNDKKISKTKFDNVMKKYITIKFVDNNKSNRKKYGVN